MRVQCFFHAGFHEGDIMGRSSFGSVEKLPSGRYRARYAVPGTRPIVWVKAPMTFSTKKAATSWLAKERVDLEEQRTRPEVAATRVTVGDYCDQWIDTRRSSTGGPLRPQTKRPYRSYLENHIRPVLGSTPLPALTPEVVRVWYATLSDETPTVKARTYSFLRTVLTTAVQEGLLDTNPCAIRGATRAPVKTKVRIATPAEVDLLYNAMPEHLRVAILLGAWGAMRIGEVLELRVQDVDPKGRSVRVERGGYVEKGKEIVGDPKTAAGKRTIALPPHMHDELVWHLQQWTAGPDSLLFPANQDRHRKMHISTFGGFFRRAAAKVETLPPTFRFHHLRHTGLTYAAQAGATVAELMARAGHATPGVALRYQHATTERDEALANAMSGAIRE
jgi:integrase